MKTKSVKRYEVRARAQYYTTPPKKKGQSAKSDWAIFWGVYDHNRERFLTGMENRGKDAKEYAERWARYLNAGLASADD